MKQILIIISLIFIHLQANHVRWNSNFDSAHKEALVQNKTLMVLLIKKECQPCLETLKTTFTNQDYIDEINKKYISVLITKDQKSSYPIEMLYTFTYPSLFFLDKQELFACEPIRGELTPEKLKIQLELCK